MVTVIKSGGIVLSVETLATCFEDNIGQASDVSLILSTKKGNHN